MIFDDFLRSWYSFAKFREIFLRNSAKFREIIYTKFREINFYFRINFVFREIEKGPFVSTLPSCEQTRHIRVLYLYIRIYGWNRLELPPACSATPRHQSIGNNFSQVYTF
jgi:hypothetical protein